MVAYDGGRKRDGGDDGRPVVGSEKRKKRRNESIYIYIYIRERRIKK